MGLPTEVRFRARNGRKTLPEAKVQCTVIGDIQRIEHPCKLLPTTSGLGLQQEMIQMGERETHHMREGAQILPRLA